MRTITPEIRSLVLGFCSFVHHFLLILQIPVDTAKRLYYPLGVQIALSAVISSSAISHIMSVPARTAVVSNLRNNRSLPQNLWDVIERFGHRQT